MSYIIERLPNKPVILQTFHSDFDTPEWEGSAAELVRLLDDLREPVYFICDMTQISLGLDNVISAANRATTGSEPIFHHPKIQEIVLVSNDALVKLAAWGLNTVVFCNMKVWVFGTLDEALAYTTKTNPRSSVSVAA